MRRVLPLLLLLPSAASADWGFWEEAAARPGDVSPASIYEDLPNIPGCREGVVQREDVTRVLMRAQLTMEPAPMELPDFITSHIDPLSGDDDSADIDWATGNIMSSLPPLQMPLPPMPEAVAGEDGAVGAVTEPESRNSPCPCGSGRKYKHCHGAFV